MGDVKVGTGGLELVRLRMDRQTSSGNSILRQYALPGGTYPMNPGETIELWAEFDTAGVPRNPRLIVNWGEGEADFTGCGSCRLTHRYNTRGLYPVSARLDDLSGTTVTRTFTLDSTFAAPTPTPSPTEQPIDSHTGGGQTVYRFSSRPLPPSPTNLASWYQQICEAAGLRPVSCDYNIYGSGYNASAWNAVILGNAYWSCNVSSGISNVTGWSNIITFHIPLGDNRGLCEEGCTITGSNVFPICTDVP